MNIQVSRMDARCVVARSLILVLALAIGGCGSGSSGSDSPSNPAVSLTAVPSAIRTTGAAPLTSTIGTAPMTVSLSGAASRGSIVSYRWSFSDDGSTATGVSTSHTFNSVGTHTVTLTVTDSGGATATSTLTISVNASAPVGELLFKNDTFTEASDTALTSHNSDSGTAWTGADSSSFTVRGGEGTVYNTTAGQRVALAQETVSTQFHVAEIVGRTGAGEMGVVVGWSGTYASGTGYLLSVNGSGVVSLLSYVNGNPTILRGYTVSGWNQSTDYTLKLVYEPCGNGYAMLAAYLNGQLLSTNFGGALSMYSFRSTRLAANGKPGIYASGNAARISTANLSTTDGVTGGRYTWPNVTMPYRAPMGANMPVTSSGGMGAVVTTNQTVASRNESLLINLSSKVAGFEGYGGTGMGQPGEWAVINGYPQILSMRWEQYLGTGLNALHEFKQQVVNGSQSNRRGAVLVIFGPVGAQRDIGIGIPSAVNGQPQVTLGQWQQYEAVYDYANQTADIYRYDGGPGWFSSYALTGFNDAYIQFPEGMGWYWDDVHTSTPNANTIAAVREVYFATSVQGP